jgi:hypothetical protein
MIVIEQGDNNANHYGSIGGLGIETIEVNNA